jgi:N-acyl-D-amino-acid deacylase
LKEKAERFGVEVDWQSADGYFTRLENSASTMNRAFLVGHGRVRASVMGASLRQPNDDDVKKMQKLVEDAMDSGAVGLSSGLAYAPSCHATVGEITELCRPVATAKGIYATHMRSEGEEIFEAFTEAQEIALNSGCRLQVSHVKISNEPNWHKLDLLKLRMARFYESGHDFGCDWYPYEAWNANLDSILPAWVYEGGTRRLLSRLRDPELRKKLAVHIVEASKKGMAWENVMVGTVTMKEHKGFQGRSIAEIAHELSLTPEDAFFHLILAEGGRAEGIITTMSKDVQQSLFAMPFVSVGSDSTARKFSGKSAEGHQHPRTYGTAAKVLKLCIRENLLPLEEGIRRMTSLPASQFGIEKRGLIKSGNYADLAVFDRDTVKDKATYRNPYQRSEGIIHVIVNGEFAIKDAEFTGKLSGKFLRKS